LKIEIFCTFKVRKKISSTPIGALSEGKELHMSLQENQKIIEKPIGLPKKSKEENSAEFQAFRDNFDLIMKHPDMIINTPELYFTSFSCAFVSLSYLGHYQVGIGHMLELWEQDLLIDTCDHCQGPLYIFSAGGSLLSGSNGCVGICGDCKKLSKKVLPSTLPILEALKHVKSKVNKQKILKTKGQYFSWKHGLVGKPVPDKVIESGVEPASVKELVERLRQFENGNDCSD
jgi:hypothetical protein